MSSYSYSLVSHGIRRHKISQRQSDGLVTTDKQNSQLNRLRRGAREQHPDRLSGLSHHTYNAESANLPCTKTFNSVDGLCDMEYDEYASDDADQQIYPLQSGRRNSIYRNRYCTCCNSTQRIDPRYRHHQHENEFQYRSHGCRSCNPREMRIEDHPLNHRRLDTTDDARFSETASECEELDDPTTSNRIQRQPKQLQEHSRHPQQSRLQIQSTRPRQEIHTLSSLQPTPINIEIAVRTLYRDTDAALSFLENFTSSFQNDIDRMNQWIDDENKTHLWRNKVRNYDAHRNDNLFFDRHRGGAGHAADYSHEEAGASDNDDDNNENKQISKRERRQTGQNSTRIAPTFQQIQSRFSDSLQNLLFLTRGLHPTSPSVYVTDATSPLPPPPPPHRSYRPQHKQQVVLQPPPLASRSTRQEAKRNKQAAITSMLTWLTQTNHSLSTLSSNTSATSTHFSNLHLDPRGSGVVLLELRCLKMILDCYRGVWSGSQSDWKNDELDWGGGECDDDEYGGGDWYVGDGRTEEGRWSGRITGRESGFVRRGKKGRNQRLEEQEHDCDAGSGANRDENVNGNTSWS